MRAVLLTLLVIVLGVGSAFATVVGDPAEGRVRFLAFCSGCHGVPPDHRAMQAAGNPDALSSALNSVSGMGFLVPLISRDDINNIAVYLGDAPLNQAVTAVNIQGSGSGFVISTPAGINCGALCVWNFAPNTSVVLQAVPKIGSTFAGWSEGCTGTAECRVSSSQARTVTARFERNGPLRDYSGMWWVGPSESGWGIAINQRAESGQQFNKLYAYDDQGQPVWYSMPAGQWSENFAVYRGPLYRPRSASLDRYDATQLQLGAAVGELTLRYIDADRVELSYRINGISATKTLSRQLPGDSSADAPFGLEVRWRPACQFCRDNRVAAPAQVGGLWWGESAEDGWSVSIAPQRASFFAIWFTFALDGSPTWYVMPSGGWLGSRYSATMFRVQAGPWLGRVYDPTRLIMSPVGSVSFDVGSSGDMRFTYRFDSGVFTNLVHSKNLARRTF
ncbi:MAG: cytochrome c [Rhodocyclaceae bacterium]|nr:cytochrome c [Rhodocyclaceae bacterium]